MEEIAACRVLSTGNYKRKCLTGLVPLMLDTLTIDPTDKREKIIVQKDIFDLKYHFEWPHTVINELTLKKISGTKTAPLGHRLTVHKTGPLGALFWCQFPKGHCFPIQFLYKNRATGH